MKTILVPFERHDLIEASVGAAVSLGRAFGSHIEGCPLGPPLSPFIGADAIGGTIYDPGVYAAAAKSDRQSAEDARRDFERLMEAAGVAARGGGGASGPDHGWFAGEPVSDTFVGAYARVFDVTVVARPGTTATSARMSTLEAALFDSGRPILIAPPKPPAKIGEVVSIAWNRSTETARAVALAMPILRQARRTIVLYVEGAAVEGPGAEQLTRYLTLNGIASDVVSIPKTDPKSTGVAILAESARTGCDLVIKGAYTQSRLRQMIFGGATSHMIAETELPVFMAH